MKRIREVIVVEGRYDKNTLKQVVDATVVETGGFGVFNDKERLALLRRLAKEHGLIILTDSDGAGFVIRNFLKSAIEPKYLLHAYIPDIAGKEKRKASPGKEGKLGVEGMSPDVILSCLRRAGASFLGEDTPDPGHRITKQDLVELGLSGGAGSSAKRKALLKKLDFPQHMSANAMLQALDLLYDLETLKQLMMELPAVDGETE